MKRRQVLDLGLVIAGLVLFMLGFLTQSCPPGSPGPPILSGPLTTGGSLNCMRPAFPLVLVFWLPALVLSVLGVVLYRRASAK